MSGAWANCSPTSSLPLLGLNQADEGLRANDRSLILSRRGGPGFVSERGSCAPSPDSGVLPEEINRRKAVKTVQHHVYVAKRKGLPASLTIDQWLQTLKHFHYLCAYCQQSQYEVLEHHIPII